MPERYIEIFTDVMEQRVAGWIKEGKTPYFKFLA